MDPEGIRRCMSLGFSSKRSKTTIGQCNCLYLTFISSYVLFYVHSFVHAISSIIYFIILKMGTASRQAL